MSKFNIQKWNHNFKLDTTILCVGKRGSGKTTLLYSLLHSICNKVDLCIAMSPTISTQKELERHVPKTFIFKKFREDKVHEIFKQQRIMIEKGGQIRRVCLVLDDLLFDRSVLRGKAMREVFQNGRHLYITCICTCQYLFDVGPSIRSNCDICLALAENVHKNKEKLYQTFFGFFDTYRDFNSVFTSCTQNFEALVMDLTRHSNEINDCVFWYKAPMPVPPFRIGNDIYFRLSSGSKPRSDDDESIVTLVDKKKKRIRTVTKCDEYGNKLNVSYTR